MEQNDEEYRSTANWLHDITACAARASWALATMDKENLARELGELGANLDAMRKEGLL